MRGESGGWEEERDRAVFFVLRRYDEQNKKATNSLRSREINADALSTSGRPSYGSGFARRENTNRNVTINETVVFNSPHIWPSEAPCQ